MSQLMSDPMSTTALSQSPAVPGLEGSAMLLHEALARSRMQEAQVAAREWGLVREATAGRRWDRLARFAARRAALARAVAAPTHRDVCLPETGLRGAV